MENSRVVIPNDFDTVLKERSAIWEKLDAARVQAEEIDALSKLVRHPDPTGPISALANPDNPVAEINATL